MASPGPKGDNALNHTFPGLLVDERGGLIVPTVVPPATELDNRTGKPTTASSAHSMAGRPSAAETGSHVDVQHASAQNIDPSAKLEKTETDANAPKESAPESRVKRVVTAPSAAVKPSSLKTWQAEPSKPNARLDSLGLLGGVKKWATVNDTAPPIRAPGSYQFDPSSADLSSSSSSEDEVAIHNKKKKKKKKDEANQTEGIEGSDKKRRQKGEHGSPSSMFKVCNEHYKTKGKISKRDGRLNISINETANSGYIAKALGQSIKHHLDVPSRHKDRKRDDAESAGHEQEDADSLASSLHSKVPQPRLNIVVMVIGSRGDIQPFLKIGKLLQEHGHRVRIATHPAFREFVQNDTGLEFFSVGGDPAELMAFMVKNPGLIPSLETVKAGEIQRRRAAMKEMFEGFWRACINATDEEKDKDNMKMMGDRHPFIAHAIIANPPSFAHVHIAERLGIPLHMMFTFPYSPTQQFPHPLANIKAQKCNVDPTYVNFVSYALVEMMTWQGLGDIVNRFREKTLGLEPVSSLWAPGALFRMKVPYTYMWSPSLVPKPKDWGPEIDIGGFVFLDLASNFKPPKELRDFLDAGERPVYIGFGSIVVDDPNAFTDMIFEAVEMAGVRALVSKGWGGLGGDNTPDNVFMLENTPHDWLFPRCAAVVHHGGAGTTAIGLKCGKPTMIVPFFGDQPFWGAMVAEAKAGAHQSTPYKKLTAERLAEGIKQCLTEEAQNKVQHIADSIANEGDGAENAVKSFHRSLPQAGPHSMRCSVLEDRVAVWQLKGSSLRLSALAAELLVEKRKFKWSDLRLLRFYSWNDFDGPGEPITGGGGAILKSGVGVAKGVGMVPVRMAKHIKKREEHARKKDEARGKREERKKKRAAAMEKRRVGSVEAVKRAKEEAAAKQSYDRDAAKEGVEEAETTDSMEEQRTRPLALAHADTRTTLASVISAEPQDPLAQELAEDVGTGLKRSGAALATAPLDLHLAIAQGFHNAPRLWGDATVRKPVRITGFKSGCTAARNEFAYGVYDGVTGLVTQPIGGWQDGESVGGKFVGLGKGFGRGIGGFVLKDISAIIAPPAFFGMGLRKELKKRMGGQGTDRFIRNTHIIQGHRDLQALETQDGGHGKDEQLERVQQRVNDAWRVYERVWDAADHYKEGKVLGSWRLKNEKRRWAARGALENVSAADRALHARRNGQDVEKLFARPRREIKVAEQPRAPAMAELNH